MKNGLYIFALLLMTLFVACDRSDKSGYVSVPGGVASLPDDNPTDLKIKEMFAKYGVLFKYEFTDQEYVYNWTENLTTTNPYTPAQKQYALQVINAIESWAFNMFPESFIKNNMQLTILLADSVKSQGDNKKPIVKWNNMYGSISRNYMILSMCSDRFDPSSTDLRDAWKSIVIERMMGNKSKWPKPQKFADVSGDTYGSSGNYWDGNPAKQVSWGGSTPPPVADYEWWGKAILKPGREGWMEEYFYGMLILTSASKASLEQDLADYVVFITTKTAAEKQAFYDQVAAKPDKFGGAAAVTKMKQKVVFAKEYFLQNFNITLIEP